MKTNAYIIKEPLIYKSINVMKERQNATFSSHELKRELEKNGVPKVIGYKYISLPAASQIIQRLKKENLIVRVYGGGYNTLWKFKVKYKIKKEHTAEELIKLFHQAKTNATTQRRAERGNHVRVRSSFWDQAARDYLNQIKNRVLNHKGEILKYAKKIYGNRLWFQGEVLMIDYMRTCKSLFNDRRLLMEAGYTVLLNKVKKIKL